MAWRRDGANGGNPVGRCGVFPSLWHTVGALDRGRFCEYRILACGHLLPRFFPARSGGCRREADAQAIVLAGRGLSVAFARHDGSLVPSLDSHAGDSRFADLVGSEPACLVDERQNESSAGKARS